MDGENMEICINDKHLVGYDKELTIFKLYRNNVNVEISYIKRKRIVTTLGKITMLDLADRFIMVNSNIKIPLDNIKEVKIEA